MAYLTQLQSSALSNQNISSALLLVTFTNTTRLRKIYIDVFADQIAGNGDYVVYATRQRSGAGAAYEIGARTTVAVPSGVTSQMFPTIALTCGATDVIKIYLVGLAGDTTTPDTIVEVSEEFVLTDSSGNVTPVAADVRSAVGLASANLDTQFTTIDDYLDTEIAAILAAVDTEVAAIKAKTDNLPSDPADESSIQAAIAALPTAAEIDTELSGTHGAGLWGGAGGTGFYTVQIPCEVSGSPADGVQVMVTDDVAGTNIIAQTISDSLGIATVYLDAGDYYVFLQRGGDTFPNPTLITVP